MWYSVNLLFESVHEGQAPAQSLWEERVVLLNAASEAAAQEQGEKLGKSEETAYTSVTGENVRWCFRRIERVFPIDTETLESGTELFSRFLRASEVQSLLTPFQEKPAVTTQAKSA